MAKNGPIRHERNSEIAEKSLEAIEAELDSKVLEEINEEVKRYRAYLLLTKRVLVH